MMCGGNNGFLHFTDDFVQKNCAAPHYHCVLVRAGYKRYWADVFFKAQQVKRTKQYMSGKSKSLSFRGQFW